MKRPKEIHIVIKMIKNLDRTGCYVPLWDDEAGIEVRNNEKSTEKIRIIGHEFGHFLLEYFLPNLPSKRRKKCLSFYREQILCETMGKSIRDILEPFIKEYYRDYGKTKK